MKYIVMTGINKKSIIKFPFIFPAIFVHSHVEKCMSLLVGLMFGKYVWTCTSAGEINSMDFNGGECYGESTSLGVKADSEDSALISGNDYGSSLKDI